MLLRRHLVFLLALFGWIGGSVPVQGQEPLAAERITFAGYFYGQWDIFAIAPDGSPPRQLTNDPYEDLDPAYAPDGTRLAFASRRDSNWDVYILDLVTGLETRLTTSPEYDGAPAWSPDGKSLVYESHRDGNLDIWRVNLDTPEAAANLTADSPAGDFAPAWSLDGRWIAFTSWREGTKDLFLLDPAGGQSWRLTDAPTAEEWPAWHPDGDKLAFVGENLGDRELFVLDVTGSGQAAGRPEPLTWLGRTDGPVWSPAGDTVAAVFHRLASEKITLQAPGQRLPQEITGLVRVQGRLTWHDQAVDFGQELVALANPGPSVLYEEALSLNADSEAEPYNLVRLNDLEVGTPWLADTVDGSFQAWRFRLRDETGYDFLGTLSDATRDLSQQSDTSQYASWHKSGRAIDTLFDYHVGGELFHEIVREDYSGDTYWRVMLRCLDQTGRCGRPITVNAWNYSTRARTQLAPEQGGLEKPNQSGYYVDLTALAQEYGWMRISSYDDVDYSWTWHFLAFEYWHYQKRLVSGNNTELTNWYQAMREVYPPEMVDGYFNWESMRAVGEDPYLIALKGVPLPLEKKPWWNLVQP